MEEEVVLVQRGSQGSGVSVIMPNCKSSKAQAEGYAQNRGRTFWHKYLADAAHVKVYVEAKWRGFVVSPHGWHETSEVPLVLMRLDAQRLLARSEQHYMQMVYEMRSAGWGWDLQDGGYKFCSIDELVLTEGPVPTGLF